MQHLREFAFLRSTLLPIVALAGLGTAACSGSDSNVAADAGIPDATPLPDAAVAPVFFTPRDDLSDSDLADQALSLMGFGADPGANNCEDCHGLTRQRMRYWRAITDTSITSCFSDLNLDSQAAAKEAIDCMREVPRRSCLVVSHGKRRDLRNGCPPTLV